MFVSIFKEHKCDVEVTKFKLFKIILNSPIYSQDISDFFSLSPKKDDGVLQTSLRLLSYHAHIQKTNSQVKGKPE